MTEYSAEVITLRQLNKVMFRTFVRHPALLKRENPSDFITALSEFVICHAELTPAMLTDIDTEEIGTSDDLTGMPVHVIDPDCFIDPTVPMHLFWPSKDISTPVLTAAIIEEVIKSIPAD